MCFRQTKCILDALSITMHMIDHENLGKNWCNMTSVTLFARRPAIPQRTRILKTQTNYDVSWLASRHTRGGPRNYSEARSLRPQGSCEVQLSKFTTWLARAHERMMLKCDDDHYSPEQLSIVSLILWFYVEAQTEMMREDSFSAGRKEWK